MDVTKLFDIPEEKMMPMDTMRLDAMIDTALATPQHKRAGRIAINQNRREWRKFTALAAVFAIVIALSTQLYVSDYGTSPVGVSASSVSADPYDDVSDLLIMETLNDLS